MASRIWVVVALLVLGLAVRVRAEPEGFYMGEIVFKSAGILSEYKSEKEACIGSAKALEKNGVHHKYESFKPGSDDDSITCVLRDMDSKKKELWDQKDNVTKVMKCKDGTNAVSYDNSGKFSTVRCRCDPKAGCPTTPIHPPVTYGCATPPDHPVCTGTAAPPGVEKSDRCTQQPASPMSKKAADRHSDANKKQLLSSKDGKDTKKLYDDALKQVTKDLEVDNGVGKAFPKFKPEDMCETGGPTDVNIGMPCGTREADFAAANNIAGLGATPTYDGNGGRESIPQLDCVWHHHEELGRMQLVRKSAHSTQPHTGGVSVWKQAMLPKGVDYPLCCPPPKKK